MSDLKDYGENGEWRWECPYRHSAGCKYSILQYTDKGFEEKRTEHLDWHLKQMRDEREERAKKLKEEEDRKLKLYKPVIEAAKKDINKLVLTLYDMQMFETHGIKIDEDCVIDGYQGYKP
jgi:hypothetical protein